VVLRGQSIKTTSEHPFYVPAQQAFVPAGQLKAGDQLISHDGELILIDSVSSTDEVTTVYNLRVADHHTYFVGGALWGFDVWVHNARCAPIRGGLKVGSGLAEEFLPASTIRTIAKGEKVDDLIKELAQRTYESGGLEHAIVSLQNGTRIIASGGSGGIHFGNDVRRVIIHTHPSTTGPSHFDFQMLDALGQRSSYIYELFGGGLTRFSK